MSTLDFESDQFLQLLTDALRAGPGSPEWHEAITLLRGGEVGGEAGGVATADATKREYQLLLEARQNLESGKEYRSVRAGPGFSRRLDEAIEDQIAGGDGRRSPPTAGAVAIVSALLILTAAGVLIYLLLPGGGGVPTAAIERLSNTYFVEPMLDSSFDYAIPQDFNQVGSLQLTAQQGLRPESGATSGNVGGAIVWDKPIPANQAVAIDVKLKAEHPSDQFLAEIFVAQGDAPDFNAQRGVSSREFVWLYQAGQTKVVLPTGQVSRQTTPDRQFSGVMTVRIVLDRDVAIVEQSGTQIWAGAHLLNSHSPRHIGLRFLKIVGGRAEESPIAFTSIKLSKP